jgi:hypothetical protein
MATRDTVAAIAQQFAKAFQPLGAALESTPARRTLLRELGWDFATPPAALDTLVGPVADVVAFSDVAQVPEGQIPALLAAVAGAFASIASLHSDTSLPEDFRNEAPGQLTDYLLVHYFLDQQPRWGFLLFLLRIIRLDPQDEVTGRLPYTKLTFAVGDIDDLLGDPLAFLKAQYGWATSDFRGDVMVDGFQGFLDAWGARVYEDELEDPMLAALTAGALAPDEGDHTSLRLTLVASLRDPEALNAGVGLFLLPETATNRPGYALLPISSASFDQEINLSPNLTLTLSEGVDLTSGVGMFVRPDQDVDFSAGLESGTAAAVSGDFKVKLQLGSPGDPIIVLGSPDASRLQLGGVSTEAGLRFQTTGGTEVFTEFGLEAGKIVIKPSSEETDGFLAKLLPAGGLNVDFDLVVGFSTTKGVYFGGSGGFEIPLPVHTKIGPVEVLSGKLAVHFGADGIPVDLVASLAADFSILTATVADVGLIASFTFPGDRDGNLGPANLSLGFKPPDGAGLAIDAGPVQGGGFLFFDRDAGRYGGVLQLTLFGIGVKAFGVIDTKFADGHQGFSFVIIVVAEFTPIQLGFGFTLLGVGGLLGVNRSVDEQGLASAVRTGSLSHVLFPHDPIHDAPAIIHDLTTVFPATEGHFIVGPMAKLGWGTPTLISADLGIVIEFPGPRIAVLGVLRMLLPDPDAAILSLQMAIAGLIDFPAKKFSLDASLFDSTVAGYVVSGDMAYRLQFGDNSKFLLSVGGFNSGFSPPAPFPDLRRASVDLGVSGNPSLTASGYFALTSNTAQIGASIQLHASGAGIRLDGWLGFDVMFVFSPFSFTASINAGVRVSFHGVGFGINLHGDLSGPNPWHLKGKVCVSVLWWDACLPVDITFGDRQQAALPQIDPWVGDPGVPVTGLKDAISDPRNWAGSAPPAELNVVSLAASSTADRTPIDPLGSATLRQKVAPFNRKLEKFGEFKPIGHDRFDLGPSVGTVGVVVPGQTEPVPVTELAVVPDDFAPGHFMQLSNAQKLSMPSYVPMDAGVSVAADRIALGSSDATTIAYVTKFIDDQGKVHAGAKHQLTDTQLVGLLKRSATALAGVRRSGNERFMLAARPKKIRLGPALFVVADACTMVRNPGVTGAPISQTDAVLALREHLRTKPADADSLAVVPQYAEAA